MFPIVLRTLFFYAVVLVMMRIMGKREIGNLSPFDLVVSIMIAELAALPIENMDKPLLEGVVPLVVLLVAEVGIAYLALKSETIRGLINGTPSIVISKGIIMEKEMRRLRYNINDLLVGLRTQGIVDMSDVEYAVLEPSGTLSVIPVADKRYVTPADLGMTVKYDGLPVPLITDGRVHWENIEGAGWSKADFARLLCQKGIEKPQDVFFAYLDSGKRFKYQYRRSENRQ
ncbi:MAG: hypothetical protein FD169_105 [Bacillota bacterium]|nr:MAG: hypothetical protein FD169_105 [Bacillota bacterium]